MPLCFASTLNLPTPKSKKFGKISDMFSISLDDLPLLTKAEIDRYVEQYGPLRVLSVGQFADGYTVRGSYHNSCYHALGKTSEGYVVAVDPVKRERPPRKAN